MYLLYWDHVQSYINWRKSENSWLLNDSIRRINLAIVGKTGISTQAICAFRRNDYYRLWRLRFQIVCFDVLLSSTFWPFMSGTSRLLWVPTAFFSLLILRLPNATGWPFFGCWTPRMSKCPAQWTILLCYFTLTELISLTFHHTALYWLA